MDRQDTIQYITDMLTACVHEAVPDVSREQRAILEEIAAVAVDANAQHNGKCKSRSTWASDPENAGKPSVEIVIPIRIEDDGMLLWMFDSLHPFIEGAGHLDPALVPCTPGVPMVHVYRDANREDFHTVEMPAHFEPFRDKLIELAALRVTAFPPPPADY